MIRRVFHLVILFTIVLLAMQPRAFAQVYCGVVNLRFHHPDSSHPDEPIQITSIVTASCFFYSTVMIDLVDSRSHRTLSTATWLYNPLGDPVSPPLVNHAITENQLGYWALSLQVHFAGSTTGIQFTILVEP